MKTLVIHPEDSTTDFLKQIYQEFGFQVIRQEITEEALSDQIRMHDRVIFLGHGCSWGLLGWGRVAFHGDLLEALSNNPSNIFIWCHADIFVNRYNLMGFFTGMFISELQEAVLFQIHTDTAMLNASNELFANSMRKLIDPYSPDKVLEFIREKYKSDSCPVIRFNRERLYFKKGEVIQSPSSKLLIFKNCL